MKTDMSTGNTGKREKLKLTFPDKQAFKGTIKQQFMTTNKLSKTVNNIFHSIFKDYNGCVIQPSIDQNQNVYLQLDFIPGMDNNGGGIAAFGFIGSDGKTTSFNPNNGARVNAMLEMNNKLNNNGLATYTITQDAADILGDYTIMARPGLEITRAIISSRCAEWVEKNYMGQKTIHQLIDCIDINKLINGMMEQPEEKGDKYLYQVFPIRPFYVANPNGEYNTSYQPSANYLYSIMQLSRKDLMEMADEMDIYQGITNTNVNRLHD